MVAKKKNKKKTKVYVSRGPSLPLSVKNSKAKKAKTTWENTTKYDILEDVPIPWTRPTKRDIVFPFEGMGVGKSFQFMREEDKGQNVYSASVSYCRQPENFHKKFVTRKIKAERIKGIMWIIWGCWREEDLSPEEIAVKQNAINEKQKATLKRRRELRLK